MIPYDFFLAHAGKDSEKVEPIYDILSRDFRVFLDRRSIQPGDNWNEVLPEALKQSKVIVLLLSMNSNGAYYLQEEIARAIQLQKDNPDLYRIVPVYLDGFPADIARVPYGLYRVYSLDLPAEGTVANLCGKLIGFVTRTGDARDDSYKIKDELAFSHILHDFPVGPMVNGSLVSTRLIEAFAESVAVTDSLQVIDEANAFRKQADPKEMGSITIKKIYLPAPASITPKEFWLAAFVQARLHGPRMLAALLLSVEDKFFPKDAIMDKYKLLDELRALNN